VVVTVAGLPGHDGPRLVRGPELIIGRGSDVDVRLDIEQMAERQFRIVAVRGQFEIHDLLGKYPVRTIRPGDVIRIFRVSLSFALWSPEPEAPGADGVVRVADLLRHASKFHEREITATGVWFHGFEVSSFADAWLSCPEDWDSVADGRRYVRVTGTWHAARGGQYGHLGGSTRQLSARTIELMPLSPTIEVGPGELAARIVSLEGELVAATVPLRLGHRLASLDGILTSFQFTHEEREPIEMPVRAIVWVQHATLTVLEHTRLAEPRRVPVAEVSVHELAAHRGQIVDVVGDLVEGRYWPRLGGIDLIPPEITTTDRSALEYCFTTTPPPEAQRWQERLAKGPIRVRARGFVDDSRFSVYRLRVGDAPWPEDDVPDWAR